MRTTISKTRQSPSFNIYFFYIYLSYYSLLVLFLLLQLLDLKPVHSAVCSFLFYPNICEKPNNDAKIDLHTKSTHTIMHIHTHIHEHTHTHNQVVNVQSIKIIKSFLLISSLFRCYFSIFFHPDHNKGPDPRTLRMSYDLSP